MILPASKDTPSSWHTIPRISWNTPVSYTHLDVYKRQIYQPSNRDKLPVNIIDTPELYLYIKDWGKANDYCLVLEIANITVGAIWIRFLKNGYGYINDTIPELCMSLLKDFRNQGLGSLLIKRMLDDIKSLGYRHISLSVSKDNYAAGWYRKLGFKVYKEQKEDYIMIVDL